MLDLQEIENTIEALENGVTTFDNCLKLASLYIVRQNINTQVADANNKVIQQELDDILPQYRKYVEVKQRYQVGELTEIAVQKAIQSVCTEISEFIQVLYSSTDMQFERDAIKDMVSTLTTL